MSGVCSALVILFGIMLLGFLAERKRFFASDMALCLNQFVYWISLPALLFSQMCSLSITGEIRALLWGTLGSSFLCYALFYTLLFRVFRNDTGKSALRTLTCVFPNAAFMGIPFILTVFPGNDTALAAAMLGALLYTGVLVLTDALLDMRHSPPGRGLILRQFLTVARNPAIEATFLSIGLAAFNLPAPETLLTMTRMLGSTAAPCALFSMGMVLAAQMSSLSGLRNLQLLPLVGVSLSKLFLHPLVTFCVLALAGCSGIVLAAGTLTSAMPVGTISYVISERHGTDQAQTSMIIILSTLLSLFSLPIVMFLLDACRLLSAGA